MTSVHVVLCTYNGARFLPEQLESLRAQTRVIDRLVISDDGSTDGTFEFLSSIKLPPSALLIRNEQRLGAVENFSQALAQANGDIVFLCDQDDIWHRNKVERLVCELDRHGDTLLVHSNARLIDGAGKPRHETLFDALSLTVSDRTRWNSESALATLVRQNVVTGATVALRRHLLDLALPIPSGYWHDEWLALIAAAIGDVRRIDEPLVDYRIHPGNHVGIPRIGRRERLLAAFTKRGDYCNKRAQKLESLLQRLRDLRGLVPLERLAFVEKACRHWHARANLPHTRLSRIPLVWHHWTSGHYRQYSSGVRSLLRDLLERMP